MEYNSSNRKLSTCNECDSEYYTDTSEMNDLCPECSHILYGYEYCTHQFENGRCIKCFWNGNESGYIHQLKYKNINKGKKIIYILEFLQNKYGETNIIINDHWEADKEAIGLTDKTRQYLAYISTYNKKHDTYYLSLENPPVDDKMPFSAAGKFDDISLVDLESVLTKHLRLSE